jgi:hypothetical protein
MMRRNYQQFAITCVLAGIVLRAFTPIGYMPSSLGSGFLFELCPEQLPVGFAFNSAASGHQGHHNHGDTSSESASTADAADQCQIGHLLFSAIAVDASPIDLPEATRQDDLLPTTFKPISRTTLTAYRTRAPPA